MNNCNFFQAIKLTGQKLLNAPIIVQETQAEKNRLAAEAEKLKRPLGPTRIYVGSLHFNITEQMIKAIFEPFGIIDTVQMIHDSESGRSKGYCFIQFRDPDSAKRAMEQMNGFELAGRPIKVCAHDVFIVRKYILFKRKYFASTFLRRVATFALV